MERALKNYKMQERILSIPLAEFPKVANVPSILNWTFRMFLKSAVFLDKIEEEETII